MSVRACVCTVQCACVRVCVCNALKFLFSSGPFTTTVRHELYPYGRTHLFNVHRAEYYSGPVQYNTIPTSLFTLHAVNSSQTDTIFVRELHVP